MFNGDVTQRDPTGTTESEDKVGSAELRDITGTESYNDPQCGGTDIDNPPPSLDVLRCTEDGNIRLTDNDIYRRIE